MSRSLLAVQTSAVIGIVVAVLVVAIVIIAVVWYINTYNKLQRLKNLVEEGWSTIDVQLKKRYDLIPNLVETVKGYASHESKTLEAVIAARGSAMSATGDAKIAAENQLTGALRSIMVLQERYPDLKANAQFLDLQRQLKSIEEEIASARRYYNGTVKEVNTKIDVFPSNLVAKKIGLEKRKYFEVEGEEERKAPAVKF